MKEENYYRQQIQGLIIILDDKKEVFIARSYVKEKLQMILSDGINFHPTIKEKIGMKEDLK